MLLLITGAHWICILDYPWVLQDLLKRQPLWRVLDQKLQKWNYPDHILNPTVMQFHVETILVRQYRYSKKKLTRVMRFFASAETGGVEGKVRSTFTILHHKIHFPHKSQFNSLHKSDQITHSNTTLPTFWTYHADSQPQREEPHRGTHNKEFPKSSYQQRNHEPYSPPFPVPSNPKFHT